MLSAISGVAALSTSDVAARIKGQMVLAPLTRGGNLPFRRLCADFGMEVSMGEMIFARNLIKGDKLEAARLRRASNEKSFCVQIATNDVTEGRKAVELAANAGADWVDLNVGCPIYEATRRNLGSALLRYPEKLGRLVHGIADGSPLPLSVKVRTAAEGGEVNVHRVVEILRGSGAAAVTIHGRSATDRYSRACDWDLIGEVVRANAASGSTMPILGNGDVLTHFEASRRMQASGVDGVMVGRGALTKPWLFQEYADGATWEPTDAERVAVYRRLACYMKEHFGDDERGRKKAWNFLPWHFDFLCRYRPLPESEYASLAESQPLMQTRFGALGEEATPLERLLDCRDPKAHELVAAALWASDSDAAAVDALSELGRTSPLLAGATESGGQTGSARSVGAGHEDEELSNIPSGDAEGKRKKQRNRHQQKPQRTDEEIAALRAVRAAKRTATGAPPHVEGTRGRLHAAGKEFAGAEEEKKDTAGSV